MEPPAKSPHGKRLRQDPITWVAAILFLSLIIPYLVPGVGRETLTNFSELYADIVILALVIVAFEWTDRENSPRSAQIFRHIVVGAFVVMLAADFVYVVVRDSSSRVFVISQIYVYLFCYLLFLVAFEVQPHKDNAFRKQSWLRLIRPLGTILLLFGVLTYFVAIPSAGWEIGIGVFNPSICVFVVLDVILIIVAVRARLSTSSRLWRAVYGWLLLGFSLGLATDSLDAAMRIELIPNVDFGTPLDLLWFLQHVPFVIAGRVLALGGFPRTEPIFSPDPDTELIRAFGSGRWLVYALSIPIVHLCLHLFEALDPLLRTEREAFVLFYVLSMGGAAIVYERLLRSENRRLERDEAEAQEQLQLARRLESIGKLTAGIAHDFNNKLTVINGSSELLLDELQQGDSLRGFAEDILQAGERAAVVVSQLLAFSRKQIRRPRVIEFNREVRQIAAILGRTFDENIEVRMDLDSDVPPVEIDPSQLEQMLINLVMNARDAMPDGGQLTVSTHAMDSNHVRLTISDTGTGMPDEILARAFEPFFTTKPAGEGTGLGLATVFGLVQQNGGNIEIDSEAGAGTAVRIELPVGLKETASATVDSSETYPTGPDPS